MTIASPIRENHLSNHASTENHITLQGIRWTTYQNILDDAGSQLAYYL